MDYKRVCMCERPRYISAAFVEFLDIARSQCVRFIQSIHICRILVYSTYKTIHSTYMCVHAYHLPIYILKSVFSKQKRLINECLIIIYACGDAKNSLEIKSVMQKWNILRIYKCFSVLVCCCVYTLVVYYTQPTGFGSMGVG